MLSLRELQQGFVGAALFGDEAMLAPHVVDPDCIEIYANNARENFIDALSSGFPVVQALGGEQWFRSVAMRYWRACPSRAGNLHCVGERFADYLGQELANTTYGYFADVARLEWAYQESGVAADAARFDL